jgi:hypothetical protein
MTYLNGTDGPLGFLGVSFHKTEYAPDAKTIEEKIMFYSKTISELIDLKVQINK